MSFAYYADAGLVTPITLRYLADIIAADQPDVPIYYGSTDDTEKLQAASNPGVDALVMTPTSTAAGWAVSAVALAVSQAGLDAATPGAALALGTQILGGVGNAREIWLRVDTGSLIEARYQNLSLVLTEAVVVPV